MSRLSTFTTRALSAQFLKPTLVLLATLAVGGAWAGDNWWKDSKPEGDWASSDNWWGTGAPYILGSAASITFADAYDYSSSDIKVGHAGGGATVTWTGADAEKGLSFNSLWVGFSDGTYTYPGILSIGTGAWTANSYTYIGNEAAGDFTLTGGTYTQNGGIFVVGHGDVAGTATISGGTLNLTSGYKDETIIDDKVSLYIGENDGTGTMTISGGNVNITCKSLVGINSKGTLNMSGGTLNTSAEMRVGGTAGTKTCTADGEANISGGTFNANGGLTIGRGGNGVLNVSGTGTVNVLESFWFGAGSVGTINLEGGLLAIPHRNGWVNSSINFNGGTLKALESSDNFLNGGVSIDVKANGGTIDTNGKAITISSAVTGFGTLRIIGGGSVAFTATPTCTVVADADTTVTGAGNVASTEAVTIIAPSADWDSKTLPTTAGVKTVSSGNWATYSDGGDAYKQTLGSATAYVSIVNVGDGANGNYLTGLVHLPKSATSLSGYDVYTVLNSGAPYLVSGAFRCEDRLNPSFTGNALVQVQGDATPSYVAGAGSLLNTAISTCTASGGNTGVTITEDAQVKGSVAGGWYLYTGGDGSAYAHGNISKENSIGGNSSVRVEVVQSDSSVTIGSGNDSYIVGGSIVNARYSDSATAGDTSVVIDLDNGASGTFNKVIVGGTARVHGSHGNQNATVSGNSSVVVTAPTSVSFPKNIIGGAFAYRSRSKVSGNSSVTINGGTFTGKILAGAVYGGMGGVNGTVTDCDVEGTATLTINGGVFAGSTLSGGAATGARTLVFNENVDVSTCTIERFTAITIAKGKTVTISSSQASLFTAQGLSVEENDGIYTAKYVPKYFWTGSGSNKNWNNAANWIIGDTYETATAAESVPTAIDPVTISVADSIVIDTAGCAAQQITVDAAVTFTGNPIAVGGVTGSGTITLGDGAGFSITSDMTIANNIVVEALSSAPAMITTSISGIGCTVSGSLSGSGHIKFTGNESVKHKLTSSGNGGFTGTIELENQAGTFISEPSYGCANATWIMDSVSLDSSNFTGNGSSNNKSDSNKPVYNFGKITGSLAETYYTYRYPVIYSIGSTCGEGDEFSLTYNVFSSSAQRFRRPFIQKVGAGTLKLSGSSVGKYIMAEGVLEMVNNDIPSVESSGSSTWATSCDSWRSLVFKGGTLKLSSAVTSDPSRQFGFTDGTTAILDDGGENRTFATAIGYAATDTDSTVVSSANFTKKGTGTLTLSQPPTYTGATTVEAGTLVIDGEFNTSSTAIAPGATLKVLTPSGTTPTVSGGGLYEVAVATDGGYTVYTVVASAESIAVDGAPANIVVDVDDLASVGITPGMTDAQKSDALKATAANGLPVWQNYVMNIEGNATQKFAAVVTPTTETDMTVATSFGSVAGRTGAGVTVTYKLMKKSGATWVQVGEASATPSFSVNPSTLDANARLKIQAVFQ